MRTVFPLASISSIAFSRQTGTAPAFQVSPTGTPFLSLYPGSVGTVAFGAFDSPDYETPSKVIPPSGSTAPTSPGNEPALLQPVPPRRDGARGRLAGGDLRARLRRQQELEPVHRRLVDGAARHRDDRDQRRRSRRRRARNADRQPHRRRAGRPARRWPRDRPGRQHGDRLDRGRQRRRPVHADLEPRRPPADGDRPDAARSRDRGRDGRRRRRRPRPRPGADLVLRPVVRRHLRHEVPRRRAERPARRAERPGRRDHRDRPARAPPSAGS